MRLHYAPGACSLGIHVLLEEIGRPFETARVNLREGEQYKPPFVDLNPKSKVPTLVLDDGAVLTEFPAIAYYLARSNPQKHLLPDDPETAARSLETMDYAVATLHMQGFGRMFRPENFSPDSKDHDAVKARGREIMARGLELLEKKIGSRDYIAGDFSVADAALFYVEYWAAARMGMTLPPRIAAHYARMQARPAVQRAMKFEGIST